MEKANSNSVPIEPAQGYNTDSGTSAPPIVIAQEVTKWIRQLALA